MDVQAYLKLTSFFSFLLPEGEERAARAFLEEGKDPRKALKLGIWVQKNASKRHPIVSLHDPIPDTEDLTLEDVIPCQDAFELVEILADLERVSLKIKLPPEVKEKFREAVEGILGGLTPREALQEAGLPANGRIYRLLRNLLVAILL